MNVTVYTFFSPNDDDIASIARSGKLVAVDVIINEF